MGWIIGILAVTTAVFLFLWIMAMNYCDSLRSVVRDARRERNDAKLAEAMYCKMRDAAQARANAAEAKLARVREAAGE
jgi:hypothetical protein